MGVDGVKEIMELQVRIYGNPGAVRKDRISQEGGVSVSTESPWTVEQRGPGSSEEASFVVAMRSCHRPDAR